MTPLRNLNLSPMIDLALVILILVMANTPIPIDEMGVATPHRRGLNCDPLVVSLLADGRTVFNGRGLPRGDLQQALQQQLRARQDRKVTLQADPATGYDQVVELVGVLRGAGATKVSLSKTPPSSSISSMARGFLPQGVTVPAAFSVATEDADIDDDQALAAMGAIQGAIGACYADRLAARPDLAGTLRISIDVGPRGTQIADPSIQWDSVGDQSLRDCIEGVLPTLTLRPLGPGQTARIHYTLWFSPG